VVQGLGSVMKINRVARHCDHTAMSTHCMIQVSIVFTSCLEQSNTIEDAYTFACCLYQQLFRSTELARGIQVASRLVKLRLLLAADSTSQQSRLPAEQHDDVGNTNEAHVADGGDDDDGDDDYARTMADLDRRVRSVHHSLRNVNCPAVAPLTNR